MQVLFSADWHIKLGQKNVPRDWQIQRYQMMFEKLYTLELEADVHILGGDIFDTVPKPQELGMYFDYISGCKIPTYIYDGNHEAGRKGKTFMEFLAKASSKINKNVHVIGKEEHCIIDNTIDIIPYTHLKTFNPKDFNGSILCTHVRGEIPPHVVPEIDLSKLDHWPLVLAGDLHSYENSQRNILYPGSPLAISFHRNKIKNGVIILDTETMEHRFIDLELPQLLRKTVESKEEIVAGDYDHIIYEVTGNILELSKIDSDLIDKKIIKTTNPATLNLANMSIEDELRLYFSQVVQLDEVDITDTLRIYNDYYKEFEME